MDLNLNLFPNLSPIEVEEKEAKGCLQNILLMLSTYKIGIWECDLVSGELRFLNDFFRILGLDRISVNYSTLSELRNFVHPEDLPTLDVAISSISTNVSGNVSVKYRCVGLRGECIWLTDHFFFISGTDGVPDRIISYTANTDLQEQHDKQYRKLINAMPDFIFVFDENFIFVDIILPEGMRLFHTREELIGSSGRMLYSSEVSDLLAGNIRECLRTGQIRELEYHLDLLGKRYYWQARLVPIENNKVYAMIRDIGDRVKRMEELLAARTRAEEADRMKSAFLANMSHEIRTPLNAIVGFTEAVLTGDDPETKAQYMDIIRTNNDLLLQLINDILDLSRIEAGKSEMNFEDTDINTLIREVEKTIRIKIKPGVELKAIFPDEEIKVFTDHNRVTQVLFNFLSNAIKNTESGSITIKAEKEENYLRFSIIDTGNGIPEDKLQVIFNRFEKANEFIQGTGLGLAICESIVERLGGEIKVESVLGQGSIFSFTIPYRNIHHVLPDLQNIKIGDLKDLMSRKKVLIAENSEFNFSFVKDVLDKMYDVIWAKNGEEAVSYFILEKPDLILMNIQMPVMNGIDATKKIRAISSHVPIIAVTASDFYMEQRWALESGCNDVISRPYSAIKLEEIILAYS